MNNRLQRPMGARQSGVMLLEALIAILIFSLGILTVIAIQATSIKLAADAQLRTKAALLADQLVGQMWTHGGDIAALQTAFKSYDGAAYLKWKTEVESIPNGLPGVADDEELRPTVVFAGATGEVVITLFWRTPAMRPEDPAHQHRVTSQISRNL